MAGGTVKSQRPMSAPEWVFHWRAAKTSQFSKWLALAIAAAGFTFLITKVRIQITAPEKSSPRKASVIYLRDDALGRALTLRAREGGPFPSRFELTEWQGLAALEAASMAQAQVPTPAYIPALEEMPLRNPLKPLELAAKGQLFFPPRDLTIVTRPDFTPLKLVPVIYPLAGISAESVPVELPPFEATVDAAMSADSWRFLVRLNPAGSVAECVALSKGGEPAGAALEAWLQRICFKPAPDNPERWIALAIEFTNSANHGTHPR